jgi:hypothetical protein
VSLDPRAPALGLVLALSLFFLSCSSSSKEESQGQAEPRSRHAQLRLKTGEAMSLDLASALELPRAQLCRELGLYDCAREAHRVVLGGVEPYTLRIDQPLNAIPVAGPIAVDRLALAACGQRAQLDFATPVEARVFGPLARGEADARAATIDALSERLLARAPDPDERRALLTLAEPPATDRDFAVLSCFAAATSLEFLFF